MSRFKRLIGPVIAAIIFAAALFVLHRILRDYHYTDVVRYLSSLDRRKLSLALLLTALSYFVMTGYDTLAVRYIGHRIPYRRIALASFIGYAFNNNFGLSGLVGGSLRYRFYTAWRLSAIEVGKVIAFCASTFWLGFLTLGGIAFLVEPPTPPAGLHLPMHSMRVLGVLLLLPVAAYAFAALVRRKSVSIRGWEFGLPTGKLFAGQLTISLVDWWLAATILYLLLPQSAPVSWMSFISIYLLAQLAGLLSNVPGGIGVFETVIVVVMAPATPAAAVLGALVAYRAIYYLAPLALGVGLLGTHEVLEKREGVARVARLFGRWGPGVVPQALAFTTFVGGALLLFSGATPAELERVKWIRNFIPLPVVEISHFFGSIAGVALLILARGLQRRLDAAWALAAAMLAGGMVWSLLKGLDYEEAIILGGMLLVLVPSRRHFYRRASLLNEPFTAGWIVAIALILLCSVWLGLFSFKHVEYSHDLWWHFSFRADAPRFLRATVGAIGLAFAFATARLLRPAAPEPALPSDDEIERARGIIAAWDNTTANLALLRDKALLFSESGRAFLMYAVERRSWVSMGDPVGPLEERKELAWRFRELADRHAGWAVFYEVRAEELPIYVDLGLTLIKLGEEARVHLPRFTMEGGSRKSLRKTERRISAEGASFAVIQPEDLGAIMPELERVSSAWLKDKKTREKGFSLGFFSPDYLRQFPVATVTVEGRIVAFANIWTTGLKDEVSIDLMRHTDEAPGGVMDYLFIQLILWAREEGYEWFNLGMAPLSGLQSRSLGPLWQRVGSLAYRHGENFYNFQGLRQYKEKFDPVWRPMYLACPGGLVLPRILANVATLISGGLRGVFAK